MNRLYPPKKDTRLNLPELTLVRHLAAQACGPLEDLR